MDTTQKLGTHQKALSINLDGRVFGSFAEIGAGQEVARWFLRVGGASGTVAKTISAYDKEVSDDLYGAGTRYVSKPRLQAMLDNEWAQLLSQLQATRGATTKFFSFVDTVSARNFSGTNDCHGWVGLRFLQQPGGLPSDVILHVNLRDSSNVRQQEAVGILGVNLLYAAQHALTNPSDFLASVAEDLSLQRMEIDCLELSGPAFEHWDGREVHAFLVTGGYAEAVVFPADDNLIPPSELLYKRALVLAPGRFGNLDHLHADLIRVTLAELPPEELKESKGGLGLFCLSFAPRSDELRTLPIAEIVGLVEALKKMGYGVMLFRLPELYEMSAFLNRYTKFRIHFAVRLSVLVRVMEDRYKRLSGSVLEGVARLFTQNVRLVAHPMSVEEVERWVKETGLTGWTWEETDGMIHADNLHPAKPLDYLYKYLLGERRILPSKASLG
ncbi:MAG TPA: hypothetical protein VJX72_08495 [Candidatus Acidoferrum sp.]|nr:hypothetical protein [Candidatus Acidoferrum sp.]